MVALSFFGSNSTETISARPMSSPIAKNVAVRSAPSSSTRIFTNRKVYSLKKLIENRQKLERIKNLTENWNGYNAEPIDSEIVDKVNFLISKLEYQPKIFPTGRNSIQIEYFISEDNLLEIEVSNNSSSYYLVNENNEIEEEEEIDFRNIPDLITRFYAG